MKKKVPGAIKDGHVPVRTPRPVKYLLVSWGLERGYDFRIRRVG